MRKTLLGAILAMGVVTVVASACSPQPAKPLATIVFDEVPGLCFGEDANVNGVSIQVCQSSSPGTAFVRATAPVPDAPGCTYAAPNLFVSARQNSGPSQLLPISAASDNFTFVYESPFDVAVGPITVEVLSASHGSVSSCDL